MLAHRRQHACRRRLIGFGQIEAQPPTCDAPIHGRDECEIVLHLVNKPPVMQHTRVEAVLSPVEEPLALRTGFRKSDDDRRATSLGDFSSSIKINVPSRYNREIEAARAIISFERSNMGWGQPIERNSTSMPLDRQSAIDVGASHSERQNSPVDNHVNHCRGRVGSQIPQERSREHPVADVVQFHDQYSPQLTQIEQPSRRFACQCHSTANSHIQFNICNVNRPGTVPDC